MSEKKSSGCLLGCMGLLVVGAGVGLVGAAGAGAWFWMGMGAPSFSMSGGDLADFVPSIDPDLPEVEPEKVEDGVAELEPLDDDASDAGVGVEPDAARLALEQALAMEAAPKPKPAPASASSSTPSSSGGSSASSAASSSGGSSSGGGSVSSGSSGSSDSAPSAPSAGAGGGGNISVSGPASVVLLSGGARYPVPGSVPDGKYEIEASFPGESAVTVGNITVSGSHTVHCSARMGTCRVR